MLQFGSIQSGIVLPWNFTLLLLRVYGYVCHLHDYTLGHISLALAAAAPTLPP